ncbi:uncharacterized protein TEOVI_000889200 [Trypanosoma equiperdum]|uniref:Uncharacterized protein n=1 Tax=Trypanosoma equiperdum TaxID=5694 RepID=A0A1G4I3E1_TRYEQ|nr:hypothetical protein, conserved [Trypanosoma equiperdum]
MTTEEGKVETPVAKGAFSPTRHVMFADEVTEVQPQHNDMNAGNGLDAVEGNHTNHEEVPHHLRQNYGTGGDSNDNGEAGEGDFGRGKRGGRNRNRKRHNAKPILKALVTEANSEADAEEDLRVRTTLVVAEENAQRLRVEHQELEDHADIGSLFKTSDKTLWGRYSLKGKRVMNTSSEEGTPMRYSTDHADIGSLFKASDKTLWGRYSLKGKRVMNTSSEEGTPMRYSTMCDASTTSDNLSWRNQEEMQDASTQAEFEEIVEDTPRAISGSGPLARLLGGFGGHRDEWYRRIWKLFVLLVVLFYVRRFVPRLR